MHPDLHSCRYIIFHSLVLAGLLGFAGVSRSEIISVVASSCGEQKVLNCGLNATAFILKYFDSIDGTPDDLSDLASELQVGSWHEKTASLLQIKKVLENRDLVVEAFKSAVLDEVARRVDGETVCIVAIQSVSDPFGHYFILTKAKDKSVFIVDAGKKESWQSLDDLKIKWHGKWSGFCMFVSAARDTVPDVPYTFEGHPITVDLGHIKPTQGEIIATLRIKNTKDAPLVIKSARGNCGCFKSAKFIGETTNLLAPLAEGTFELRFAGGKSFGFGHVTRAVMLSVSNPTNTIVPLRILADVGQPPSAGFSWFPKKIDFGRVPELSSVKKSVVLSVVVPEGVSMREAKSSSTNIVVAARNDGELPYSKAGDGRWVFTYEINMLGMPRGRFDETLELTTSSEDMKKIVIPIVGGTVHRNQDENGLASAAD